MESLFRYLEAYQLLCEICGKDSQAAEISRVTDIARKVNCFAPTDISPYVSDGLALRAILNFLFEERSPDFDMMIRSLKPQLVKFIYEMNRVEGFTLNRTLEAWQDGYSSLSEMYNGNLAAGLPPYGFTDAEKAAVIFREHLSVKKPRAFMEAAAAGIAAALPGVNLFAVGALARREAEFPKLELVCVKDTTVTIASITGSLAACGFVCALGTENRFLRAILQVRGVAVCLEVSLVDEPCLPAAIIDLVGPRRFASLVRVKAASMGYRLDNQALYWGQEKINVKSEEQIFQLLGIKYVPFQNRSGVVKL